VFVYFEAKKDKDFIMEFRKIPKLKESLPDKMAFLFCGEFRKSPKLLCIPQNSIGTICDNIPL
jgi:hypothetical protein